jgi:hypothetical protein
VLLEGYVPDVPAQKSVPPASVSAAPPTTPLPVFALRSTSIVTRWPFHDHTSVPRTPSSATNHSVPPNATREAGLEPSGPGRMSATRKATRGVTAVSSAHSSSPDVPFVALQTSNELLTTVREVGLEPAVHRFKSAMSLGAADVRLPPFVSASE